VRTAVNVNTASREVLVAAIKGLDLATAERIVQTRQRDPFKSVAALEQKVAPTLAPLNPPQGVPRVGVTSSYFEVRGRLRLEDRVLEQRSLVERRGFEMLVLQREQVASRENARP